MMAWRLLAPGAVSSNGSNSCNALLLSGQLLDTFMQVHKLKSDLE